MATSVDEKKGAVKIRELYEKILGLPARTEPTTVAPLAGRFGIPVYGVIFAIALAFYIVGVLIDDKAVTYGFLALSMLVTILVGAMLFVQVLTNKNTFNALFPKRTSYNVLSSIEAKAPGRKHACHRQSLRQRYGQVGRRNVPERQKPAEMDFARVQGVVDHQHTRASRV